MSAVIVAMLAACGHGGSTRDAMAVDSGAQPVRLVGRFDTTNANRPACEWTGSAIEANFHGSSLAVALDGSGNYFVPVLDGAEQPLVITNGAGNYPIATGLAPTDHHVLLFRRDEASDGIARFAGFDYGAGGIAGGVSWIAEQGARSTPPSVGGRVHVVAGSAPAYLAFVP